MSKLNIKYKYICCGCGYLFTDKPFIVVNGDKFCEKCEFIYKDNFNKIREYTSGVLRILDNHFYWSQLLEFIEQNTVEDVIFTDFAGSSDLSVNLSAVGNDFKALARQLKLLEENEMVNKVSINSGVKESMTSQDGVLISEQVNFSVEMIINQELLKYPVPEEE